MITLKDIALAAGVSTATASRALNPNPVVGTYINKKTRANVLKVANRLGYAPNFSARTLSNGSSSTVGIVFGPKQHASAGSDCALQMLFGIEQALIKFNYTASVVSGADWKQLLENVKLLVEGTKCKLFVLLDTAKDDLISAYLTKKKIRFVITGEPEAWTDALYVDNDNRLVGYQAAEILLDRLHLRHLLLLTSKRQWKFEVNRLAGFKAKLQQAKISDFKCLAVKEDFQSFQESLLDVYTHYPEIDGIFATDDRLGFMAKQQYLLRFQRSIPVVSFNHSDFAAAAGDDFYSFDILPEQLGLQAVKLLFNQSSGGTDIVAGHVVIQAVVPEV